MSSELQLEEMQKTLGDKDKFIIKQMTVIQAFSVHANSETKIFEKQPSQPRHPGRNQYQPWQAQWEETAQDKKVQVERDYALRTLLDLLESLVAECPHEDLMAEAEAEGFSNYRAANCHFQLNTQASTSPSPNMPPKAFAQVAKDYGRDTQREQMSYITQIRSAGQKACLREEGLSTSNITPAFLDAAKDIPIERPQIN
ncbi:hypothetical protein PROFUN_11902 [Planoprotostelium fungivorum]|uniref:Uncharacterized protein n=1 Tax=Planoprotostelium fungivorum TaxID=1890364 RepID=A0A2P6N910_9EUKA|nr:hypothetical protein PROFUN_11902 [Planoprotostelium fungivorum]